MLSDQDIYNRYVQKQDQFNQKAQISLVGHSLFDMWDDCETPTPSHINERSVVNVGISGVSTRQYLDVVVKPHRLPYLGEQVVIFLGVNDIVKEPNYSPQQVVDWLDEILAIFRQTAPESRYYLLEATPSINRDNITNQQIIELNRYMETNPPKDITFIHSWDRFSNQDGDLDPKYTTDGLHFSAEGYALLQDILQKALK